MSMNETVWNQVLEKMSSQLSKPSFETWIKPTSLYHIDDENMVLTISCENQFARDWAESRYQSLFTKTIFEITNQTYRLIFRTDDSKETEIRNWGSKYVSSTSEQLLRTLSELNHIPSAKTYPDFDLILEMLKQMIKNQERTNELLEQLNQKCDV